MVLAADFYLRFSTVHRFRHDACSLRVVLALYQIEQQPSDVGIFDAANPSRTDMIDVVLYECTGGDASGQQ